MLRAQELGTAQGEFAVTERVEWLVGKYDEQGNFVKTRDGAQSVFSKTRAEALVKKRGPEWSLFHWKTMLSPEAQAAFEAQNKANAEKEGPQFGSQWGP
jgi:hypothetical protein